MPELEDFAGRMYKLSADFNTDIAKLVRSVATEVLDKLVRGTPVDTGVARSNWQVSIGAPENSVLPAYSPGDKLGIGETANAEGAIDAGARVLANVRSDEEVYIQNNVDYIELLNDGSSQQAPKMFVEEAIDRGLALVADAKVVR